MSRSRPVSPARRATAPASRSHRLAAEAQRQRRIAAWRRTFSRYLPFTGWRLPVQVDAAIARFRRVLGGSARVSRHRMTEKLDVSKAIWRTNDLERLEQKRVFSVSLGHLDDAYLDQAYVDDSWANESAGATVVWNDAATGSDVDLVFGMDAFATISEGVDSVRSGGVVNVAEGAYAEVLATAGKPLTLRVGGGGTAEISVEGLALGFDTTLEFDIAGVSDHDRISLASGASVFDLGGATLAIAEGGGFSGDEGSTIGLIASEAGVSVGATGTIYDRLGRPLSEETLLSASRLNFRFDETSGDFQGVFLTPVEPPSLVYVDARWAGLAAGDPVNVSGGTAIYGYDAFSDLGTAGPLVAEGGVIRATTEFLADPDPIGLRAGVSILFFTTAPLSLSGPGSVTLGSNALPLPGGGVGAANGNVIYVYNDWLGQSAGAPVTTPDGDTATFGTDGFSNFSSALTAMSGNASLDTLTVYDNGTGYAENADLGLAAASSLTLNTSGFTLTGGQTLTFGDTTTVLSNTSGGSIGIDVENGTITIDNVAVSSADASSTLTLTGSVINTTGSAGFLTVAGPTTLVANGSGDFDLAADFSSLVIDRVNGLTDPANVAINDASGVVLGDVIATDLTILALGDITTAAGTAIEIRGTLDATAIGQTIDLTSQGGGSLNFTGQATSITLNSSNDAVSLGATTAANLTIAAGSLDQTGIVTVSNLADLEAFGGGQAEYATITLLNGSNNFNLVQARTIGGALLADVDGITFGNTSVSLTFDVESGGNITQLPGSVVVGGFATLDSTGSAGSNVVLLNESGNDFGKVASAAGTLSLSDVNDIQLGWLTGINVSSLDVTAGGSITQYPVSKFFPYITVSGATTLVAGTSSSKLSTDAITLNGSNDFNTVNATGGDVTLNDSSSIVLGTTTAGNLTVEAADYLNQSAAISVTGLADLSVGESVILSDPANDFSVVNASAPTGCITLADVNGIILGDTLADYDATVTAGGNITQVSGSGITVYGTTTLNATAAAPSNTITLDEAANDFNVVNATGGDVSLNDSSSIVLGTTTASNLTVEAVDYLNQSAAISVTGLADLSVGESVILSDPANDFSVVNASAPTGCITLADVNGIILGDTLADYDATVTAGGNITQVSGSGITVYGTTTLNATAAAPSDTITLDEAANNFNVVNATGGDVSLNDSSSIVLGDTSAANLSVTAGGNLTQTAGSTINVSGGTTTLNGTVSVTTTFAGLPMVTGVTGTNIPYAVSADGSVAAGKGQPSGNAAVGYAWTNGTASDLGGSTTFNYPWNSLPAAAEVRAISGDGSVFAGYQTGPNFDNQAFVETSAGRTVITLGESRGVSGDGLVVVGDEAVGGTKRAFTWTASGGKTNLSTSALPGTSDASYTRGVNSDGSVVVGSSASGATTTGVRWVNGVAQDLGSLGGTYAEGVAVSGDGSVVAGNSATAASVRRAFRWENGTMTMLTTPAGAGTLGGSSANVWGMSGDGSIIVGESGQAGTSTAAAFVWTRSLGMVDLKNYLTTIGVDLTGWELTHAQAISFDGTTIVGQGRFNGGSVTGWIVNAFTTAPSITLFEATNDFGTVNATGGDVSLNDTNSIVLGTTTARNLTVEAVDYLNQSAAISVAGLADLSVGDSVILSDPANDFGVVNASAPTGCITLADVNGIILGDTRADYDATITAGGNITQVSGSGISVSGTTTLNATAAAPSNTITLDEATNDFNIVNATGGDVSLNDSSSIVLGTTTAGNLTVEAVDYLNQSAAISVTGLADLSVGESVILSDPANDFSVVNASAPTGCITLADVNGIILGDTLADYDATVTAGGNITQVSGSGITVYGTTTLNATAAAPSNTITLDEAANDFNVVNATGGDVSLNDSSSIVLGTTTAGNLTVEAVDYLNQSAAISVTGLADLSVGESVILSDPANDFSVVNASAPTGCITLADVNGIILGDTLADYDATVTAGGNITQVSGSGISVSNGLTTLNATAAAPSNTITLNGSNNFRTVNATGGEVTLNDATAIVLGDTSAANLSVTAAGNITQVSGSGISVSGTTTLNASGAAPSNTITLDQATNDFGTVNATGGDVSLNDSNALELGTTVASNLTIALQGQQANLTQSGPATVPGLTNLLAFVGNTLARDGRFQLTNPGNNFGVVDLSLPTVASPRPGVHSLEIVDVDDIVLGNVSELNRLDVTAAGNITGLNLTELTTLPGSGIYLRAPGQTIDINVIGNGFAQLASNFNADADTVRLSAGYIKLGDITATNLSVTSSRYGIGQVANTSITASSAVFHDLENRGYNYNYFKLDNPGNDFGTVSINSSNYFASLTDANSIVLAATSAENLTITAGGNITQTGSITVNGTTTLNATGDIDFGTVANDFNVVNATGGDITLSDTTAIVLGDTSAANLSVTAAGNITQVANSTINVSGGTTTLRAVSASLAALTTPSINGSYTTNARAISGDGLVVAGYATASSGNQSAFVWINGVPTDLGTGTGAPVFGNYLSSARALSLDGTVVGGRQANGFAASDGWVLDGANRTVLNGPSPGATTGVRTFVNGLTSDGQTVLGTSANTSFSDPYEAWTWTSAGGYVPLAGVDTSGIAISGDGSIVIGTLGVGELPHRWVNGGPAEPLPVDWLEAISRDGSTIVGSNFNASTQDYVAFRLRGGMVELLGLSPGFDYSYPEAVSADGSIVVGYAGDIVNYDDRAVLWTAAGDMLDLTVYLAELGADTTGWTVEYPYGISDDGTMIAGDATLNGVRRAFLANLNAAQHTITLNQANNDFGTVNATGGEVTLTDANSIVLGETTAANLTINAGALDPGGNITQVGAITVPGQTQLLSPNGFPVSGNLTNPLNDFGTVVLGFPFSLNTVALADANDLVLGNSSVASLTVNAVGNVTGGLLDVGPLNVTAGQTVNLSLIGGLSAPVSAVATDVTLATTYSFLNLADITATNLTAYGYLSIRQSGVLNISGSSSFSTSGQIGPQFNAITLDNPDNDLGFVNASAIGDVTLVDADGLLLGTTSAANLSITAGGVIVHQGAANVTGATTLNGTDAVLFGDVTNEFAGPVTVANGSRLVLLANGSLDVSVSQTAIDNVSSVNGSVTLAQTTAAAVNVASVSAGGGNISISTVGTTYETSLRLGTLAAAGNTVSVSGAVGFELGNATTIAPTTTVNASVLDLSAATLNATLASGFLSTSRETWVAIDTQATSLPFANAANGSIVTVDSARFDVEYGGNVTLTTSTPTTVWVYDEWAGSANGSNVSYDAVNGTFGFNAFNTISAGLAAVADAGMVYVIAGTSGSYNEALTITKDVTIEGIYPDDPGANVEGAATGAALLEGSGITSPAFTVTGTGVDATIRNLSFVEWINGGVLATNGATVTVEHVTIAGEIGGTFANFGVRVSGATSTLTVDKSLITKGTAIGAYAGVRIDDGTLFVTDSRIEYSNAPGAVAIDVNGGTASVSNNFINNNFFGVDVSNNANATISANDLTLNTRGLRNSAVSSVIVDASTNWWGSTDEAAVLAATTSTGSAGDRVDITPYVREATDTSPLAGFQPNLGNLAVTTLGPQTGNVSRLQDGIDAIQDSGNTTGIDRVLFVNPGDYSGATDVNKSLTLETETLSLNGSLTVSSDARIAEATPGNGATVTVTGAGNNLAVNANLTFTGTGELTLESVSGSLTGAGEITSATPLTLSAPNGSITSATNVSELVATASGDITITEQDGITLSNVTSTSGNVTVTAGGPLDYTLVSAAQDLSLTGTTLDLTSGTLSPGNDLSLEATAGNIDLPAGLTAAANLSVTANGTISDLGALTVAGSTTLSATGDILLDGANDFVGCVDVLAGQNVTVNDTGDLEFCGANVSGSLTATAVGNVTDSGPMTVGGVAELSAGGDVILDAANDFATVNVTATNAVLNDTNGITIGDSTLTGDLDVTGGNVSSSGNVTVTGDATLNATIGDVTVAGPGIFAADTVNATALGNGADIVLTSFDANTLNAEANCSVTVTDVDELTLQNITAGCNVTATAGGELTIPANGSVSAGCDASLTGTSLNLAGGLTVGGSLELNSTASDLVIGNLSVNGDLIGTASGNVTVVGPAVSGDDVILTGSTVTLTGTTTAANDVVLSATAGNVSGGGLVTATNVTATALAAGATISVTTAADTVAAAADCDVTIVNEGNLSLSNVSSASCSVSATANNGSLEVVTGGTVTAGEDVSLAGESLTLTGSVTAAENVTLNATVGDINGTGLVTGDNVTATAEGNDASITLNLAAVTLTAVANCSVTITEADDLAVANITSLSTSTSSASGITALPGSPRTGEFLADPNGMSGDGSIVVGTSMFFPGFSTEAVAWTSSSRTVLAAGNANDVDASGSLIVGSENGQAVVWIAGQRYSLASGQSAIGVSSDGAVVVGESNSTGAVWTGDFTTGGTVASLPGLSTGGSAAYATNPSGTTFAGYSEDADGDYVPVRWVQSGGSYVVENLGSFTPGGYYGEAYAVSDDGSVVVGFDESPVNNDYRAFRWTQATGLVDLGDIPGVTSNGRSYAYDVTADGSVVVGTIRNTNFDDTAFVWMQSAGMVDLNTYLPGLGIDLTGWTLEEARVISADGSVIAGSGRLNGTLTPWVVRLTSGPSCSVTVTTGGSLDVAGSITASGDVTLDSTAGSISGAGLITGDQLTATAANGSITANTSVASFTGSANGLITVTEADAITLEGVTSTTGDVAVTANGAITVGQNVTAGENAVLYGTAINLAAPVTAGNLAYVAATTGDISGSGLLTANDAIAVAPYGSITLSTSVNSLTAGAEGNITVTETDSITLGGLISPVVYSLNGSVNVTAGGAVTVPSNAAVDAGTDIVLTGTNVAIEGNVTAAANVNLNASVGDISGAGLVTGTDVAATALGNHADIVLTLNASTLTAAANCSVTVTDVDDLTLQNITAGCNVTATAGGELTIPANGTVSAGCDATLTGASLNLAGGLTVGGSLELNSTASDLVIGNLSVNGDLIGTANGSVTVVGPATAGDDVFLTGTSVNLSGTTTAGNDVVLNATAGNVSGGGLVTATNVTATALAAGATISVTTAADTVAAAADCDVTIVNEGNLSLSNVSSANCSVSATANNGSLEVVTGGTVTAGEDVALTGENLTLTGSVTAAENVTLNATVGDINGTGLVTGDNVTATAAGNGASITLNLAAVTLTAVADCDVTVTEADDLAIANVAAGCNVSVTAGGTIGIQGPVTAVDDVTLNTTSGNITGAGQVTGDLLTATAANGSITANTSVASFTGSANGSITITEADAITLEDVTSTTGSVSVTTGGNVTVATNATVAAGTDVSLDGTEITLDGSITAAADVTLNASTGDISGSGLVTGDNVTATAEGNDASITLNLAAVTLTAVANCSVTITEADDLAVANITSLSTAAASSAPSSQPLSFTTYTTANGLGGNFTQDIYATGGVLYAATGGGVSKTTDGGTTWTNSTTASGLGSNSVTGVFADATFVYAATRGGLSISSDGGSTWTNYSTTDGLANNIVNDVYAIGGTIYAATNAGLSVSANGGANWSTEFSGQPVKSVTGSGSTLLASVGNNGLAYSLDGGQGWAYRTTADGLAGNNTDALSIDGGTWGVGTSLGVSFSTDNGASWTSYFTPDIADNFVYGVTIIGSSYFVGTDDGGVSITTDGGTTWNTYTTDDGLGSNYTYGCLVDSAAGLLYVANDGGVSVAALPTASCSVTVTTGGSLDVAGSITASGDVTLDSTAGNITGAGLVTGDQLTATAANGSITLASNVSTLTASANGSVTVADQGELEITSVVAGTDATVTAISNLSIGSGGSVTAGATASLTGGNVALSGSVTGDNVAVNATAGDLVLQNITVTGGGLDATASGGITQLANLTVPGTTALSAGTDILLNNASNAFGGAVSITAANNATLVDGNDLVLGNTSVTDTLSATATGNITGGTAGAATLAVNAGGFVDLDINASTATATATGSITLDQTGGSPVTFANVTSTSGNISLSTDGNTAGYGNGMTIETLSAAGGSGTVTLSGGVDFLLSNTTTYQQANVAAATLDLSGASLLGNMASTTDLSRGMTFDIINTTATTIPFGNAANGTEIVFSNVGFEATYGGNVTLTVNGPVFVWVYDVWFGSTPGSTVNYEAVTASFGWSGFNTIADGYDAVATGGTVYVIRGDSGEYNEAVTITKDVTVEGIYPAIPADAIGADPGAALMFGAGITTPAFTVSGAGVEATFRNLVFEEYIEGGIQAVSSAVANVENVTVKGEVGGVAFANFGLRVTGGTMNVDRTLVTKGSTTGAYSGIRLDSGTLTVTDSEVSFSNAAGAVGIDVNGGTATVTNSFVSDNFYGIDVSNNGNATITENDLSGNSVFAVRNSAVSSVVVNASNNWWGTTDENAVLAATNSTGAGGSRVDVTPYLSTGTDMNVTAGFQPDLSQLTVTALGAQTGSTSRLQEGVDSIADGSLTGENRILTVNPGTYTGSADVNQSLTLDTAGFTSAGSLTLSSPIRIPESSPGAGATFAVTGTGNNLVVDSTVTFTGSGPFTLESAGGSLGGTGSVVGDTLNLSAPAGSIDLELTAAAATANASGDVTLSQTGNQAVTFTNVSSTAGNVSLSTDGTTVGTGMTLGTLSAGAANGTVTASGGVEFYIGNGTNYTTTTVSDGQLVLSSANLLLTSDPAYVPAPGASFPIIQTGESISGTFTNLPQNGTISVGGVSLTGSYDNNLTLSSTMTAPQVTNVYVNGNGSWTADFRSYLETSGQGNATLGYEIPTGNVAAFNRNTPSQLNTIPWFNVNQIRITFSEDVAISAADLVITGVNTSTYVGSFDYGLVGGQWTATWTSATFLPADKLLVNVAGTVASPTSGQQLAGAWTQPTPSTAGSAMPSGLPAGTPFNFRVNMMPGDVNSDTAVSNADVSLTRAALFTTSTNPGTPPLYTIFKDVNGDGAISNADVSITRARLFTQLPAGEPTPPVYPTVATFGSLATDGGATLAQARQAAFAAYAAFEPQAEAEDDDE